jgi:ABC-type phosphate transport system ATPase subunit
LLIDLGLDAECLQWPVSRLSTGEKQRLALIRALVLEPAVLLLDEPTSALDADATAAVERAMMQRLDAGTTLIIVTHDAEQARRLNAKGAIVRSGVLALASEGWGQ